jgi:hypothetical protein
MMVTIAMVLRLVPPASALLVSHLPIVVVMTSVRQARILHHVLPTVAPSSLRQPLKITMDLVVMSSRYEQRKISL